LISTGESYFGTSATFYGGAHTINATFNYFTSPDDTGITDNGSTDAITFAWPGNSNVSAFGEVLWQQSDFLNGASSSTVAFDSLSSISVSLAGLPATTRFIVEDDGTYYLSNLNFTTSTTLTDPNVSTTWAPYVPSADASATPFDSTTATFTPQTFPNVEAIGYYFDSENEGDEMYDYEVNGFSAQVATVPEPSGVVLLGIPGLALFAASNFKRFKAKCA
jgi:hypothetical protein